MGEVLHLNCDNCGFPIEAEAPLDAKCPSCGTIARIEWGEPPAYYECFTCRQKAGTKEGVEHKPGCHATASGVYTGFMFDNDADAQEMTDRAETVYETWLKGATRQAKL